MGSSRFGENCLLFGELNEQENKTTILFVNLCILLYETANQKLMKYLHANRKVSVERATKVMIIFIFVFLPEAERYSNINLNFDQKLVSAKLRNRQLTFHQ